MQISEDALRDVVLGCCVYGRGSECLCCSRHESDLRSLGLIEKVGCFGGALLSEAGLRLRDKHRGQFDSDMQAPQPPAQRDLAD